MKIYHSFFQLFNPHIVGPSVPHSLSLSLCLSLSLTLSLSLSTHVGQGQQESSGGVQALHKVPAELHPHLRGYTPDQVIRSNAGLHNKVLNRRRSDRESTMLAEDVSLPAQRHTGFRPIVLVCPGNALVPSVPMMHQRSYFCME